MTDRLRDLLMTQTRTTPQVKQVPWTWGPPDRRIAKDLVTRAPRVLGASTRVSEAERIAADMDVHHLPVVGDSGETIGILCVCDLWRAAPNAHVSVCMSSPVITIDAWAPAEEAADLMREKHVGCLPVLDDGQIVGMLTRGDMRRAGLVAENECDRCASCWSFHHVRTYPGTRTMLCLKCLEDGQPRTLDEIDDDDLWD